MLELFIDANIYVLITQKKCFYDEIISDKKCFEDSKYVETRKENPNACIIYIAIIS